MTDWFEENWWRVILTAAALGIITTLGFLIFEPHDVNYYYASTGEGSKPAYCVYAHWTWHGDEVAFCSDDSAKVLDFMVKANNALPKH